MPPAEPPETPQARDRRIICAARGLLYDGAITLEDVARRVPAALATRVTTIIEDMNRLANDLEAFDDPAFAMTRTEST